MPPRRGAKLYTIYNLITGITVRKYDSSPAFAAAVAMPGAIVDHVARTVTIPLPVREPIQREDIIDEAVERGEALIGRLGPPVVDLSHATIGIRAGLPIEPQPGTYALNNPTTAVIDALPHTPATRWTLSMVNEDDSLSVSAVVDNRFSAPAIVAAYHSRMRGRGYIKPLFAVLQLYDTPTAPADFALYDDPTLNCVVNALVRRTRDKKLVTRIKTWCTRNGLVYDALTYQRQPMTRELLTQFCTQFRVHAKIYTQARTIWAEEKPPSPKFTLDLWAHDAHAVDYTTLSPKAAMPIRGAVSEEDAFTGGIRKLRLQEALHGRLACNGKRYNLLGYHDLLDNTVHKSYMPPVPAEEQQAYAHCYDEQSYLYTRWKRECRHRPLQEPYQSIMRVADHHITCQAFTAITDPYAILHKADQCRAFASYRNSPLYPQYQIAVGPFCLYANTDLAYIERQGVSRVTIINYHGQRLLEKMGIVQPMSWYWHALLHELRSHGVTFTIDFTVLAGQEDADIPVNPYDSTRKLRDNAFLGRLIPGDGQRDKRFTEYYTATDPLEIQQLQWDFSTDGKAASAFPLTLDGQPDKKAFLVEITQPPKDKPSQLHHIHGSIVAYQQVAMVAMIVANPHTVAYCVDGLASTQPFVIPPAYAADAVNRRALRYRPDDPSPDTPPGSWTREMAVINYATPADGPIHVTDGTAYSAPAITVHAHRLSQFTLTTGPPGCGKSYTSIQQVQRPSQITLYPTNALLAADRTSMRKYTVHKFLGIGVTHHKQQLAENIVVDEASMVPRELWQKLIDLCTYHRIHLHMIGDIGTYRKPAHEKTAVTPDGDVVTIARPERDAVIIYQRAPPQAKKLSIEQLQRFQRYEEIAPHRRQNATESAFLDSLRPFIRNDAYLIRRLRATLDPSQFITVSDVKPIFIAHPDSLVIVGTHARAHMLTWEAADSRDDTFRARYVGRRTERHHRGSLERQPASAIWWGRTSSEEPTQGNWEPAYAVTGDFIQGATIGTTDHAANGTPVIVDSHRQMQHGLYVAITRVTSLAQLRIIA